MVSIGLPSTQLTRTVCVSRPGSENVPPTHTRPLDGSHIRSECVEYSRVMVGATFSTSRRNVVELLDPSLSVAVIVTVRLWSRPSFVANDHDQVPSAL